MNGNAHPPPHLAHQFCIRSDAAGSKVRAKLNAVRSPALGRHGPRERLDTDFDQRRCHAVPLLSPIADSAVNPDTTALHTIKDKRAARTEVCSHRPRVALEHIMQAQLNLPRRRTHAGYQPKAAQRRVRVEVAYLVVGIPIAGDIEDVEKVSAESEHLPLAPQVEIFKERSIHLAITGRAFRAIVGGAEFQIPFGAIGASSVV